LVHKAFFSDLAFTANMRVTRAAWHPIVAGLVAVACAPNGKYEDYLEDLSKRLVMPNVITVWSLQHTFFPQVRSGFHSRAASIVAPLFPVVAADSR